MTSEDNIIRLGQTVIFDAGEKQSFIAIRNNSKVKLGKVYCSVEPLIGCPYGSMFTLSTDGKSLERTEHTPSKDWDEVEEQTANNSKLSDNNSANQQLTREVIEAMRDAGTAGTTIIDALTTNSATFHAKTLFAQEKYKKRKAKKYVHLACVRRPTAATVAAAYFCKQPSRIGWLRGDALALMLSFANVGPNARVLVMETCGGLVAGAVAERLGGYGVVCSTYVGPKPPSTMQVAHTFNFNAHVAGTLRTVPLLQLLQQRERMRRAAAGQAEVASSGQAANGTTAGQAGDVSPAAVMEVGHGGEGEGSADGMDVDASPAAVPPQDDPAQPMQAAAPAERQSGDGHVPAGAASSVDLAPPEASHGPPYTGLILAVDAQDPTALLRRLLPLLMPSASIAVYCRRVQPLAEAMDAMKADTLAVHLTLHESWWRQYQVLPLRTHPLMNMHHGGGYLLSATATVQGASLPTGVDANGVFTGAQAT